MKPAVAAGHPVTARAAARVLAQGGNAVDAVVAAAAMSWAAEPGLTGPCGGGFLLVRPARSGRVHALDAFTAIPGRDLPAGRPLAEVERVLVPFDAQTTQEFHIGAAAFAVPGVLAGLEAVHRRYGSLPWRHLLLPAAATAADGVPADGGQYAVLVAIRAILEHTPEVRAVFSPGGRWVAEGDLVRQPDLAGTIELLAERPHDLYSGALARAIVAHQERTGGRLTAADLATYRPIWRRPLEVPYRRHTMASNPPPSSGGVLIAHMLAVLEGIDGPLRPGRARTLRAYAETMRAAARMRDARFTRLLHRGRLGAHMLSTEAVAASRTAVAAALAGEPTAAVAVPSDAGTTHISIVDHAGNACAFTASNGCHSGVIVPGTGLHLNNMMGEEDLAAGRGMPPGTRLTSMQAPSMVAAGDRLELVIGSSGSNRLRSAIMQVAVNVLDHGMPAAEAVSYPRVNVEGDRLDCEGGLGEEELELLERWGERLNRFDGLNLYFGGANVVAVRDGRTEAAGDPRRNGHGIVLDE
ncbi:MAG TPA: gamma-glutamyltransferase [Gaiellales bacterium]|nr:gamma-glutamyltransferase [Gaiellales bacterium]